MTADTPFTEIIVDQAPFDLAGLYSRLRGDDAQGGAIVTFTGLVREVPGARLKAMFLEHYPGMTEKALAKIVDQARVRWPLAAVLVHHRIGRLSLGDEIVFVGVCSAHRQAAFEAAQFIMDYLKRDATFWKKEIMVEGEHWVEQKQSDLSAAESWGSERRDADS